MLRECPSTHSALQESRTHNYFGATGSDTREWFARGALMSATGWRLLLGLDLGHLVAAGVVEETRAASAILGSSLAGVTLGNEPDLYTHPPSAPFRFVIGSAALRPPGWGLEQYEGEISSLRAALAGAGAQAPLYGPDTATSGAATCSPAVAWSAWVLRSRRGRRGRPVIRRRWPAGCSVTWPARWSC